MYNTGDDSTKLGTVPKFLAVFGGCVPLRNSGAAQSTLATKLGAEGPRSSVALVLLASCAWVGHGLRGSSCASAKRAPPLPHHVTHHARAVSSMKEKRGLVYDVTVDRPRELTYCCLPGSRGGKKSNFKGGVRVNALVSGGLVPAAARGTTLGAWTALEDQ